MPPRSRAEDIIAQLRPGMTVYVGGVTGEPLALRAALAANPAAAAGVTFVGAWLPGINEFDYAGLHPDARSVGLFVTKAQRASFAAGRHRFLPVSWAGFGAVLRETRFDQAWLQAAGARHAGLNADFVDVVRADEIVGEANPHLTAGARATALARIDTVVESTLPLPEFPPPAETPEAAAIAARVAELIADGDTLQVGIGALPSAVLRRLGTRRELGLHSGVISDPCLDLIEAGVMTGARKEIDPGEAVATAAIGTARLHAALAGAAIALRPSSHVHAPGPLGQLSAFVSLNSALEVDLLGQVNTTSIAGRLVSGMGGFTDFARPARQSPKGRAIVMLPATAGPHSRIVAQFAAGTPVTASALDIDMVVTEHGVARLAGHDWDARATALIAIAAPAHRDALAAAWREIRAGL